MANNLDARSEQMTKIPTVTLLSSGYWHVRWCADLWIQFPQDRSATLSDGFGWITQEQVRIANKIIEEIRLAKEGGRDEGS